MRPLDHFDCVIMAELQVRGDLPNVELARRLGLSPAATLRRVQQLRSDGRIEGIRAVINHEKVELRTATTALERFLAAMSAGWGDEDMAAVVKTARAENRRAQRPIFHSGRSAS